MFKTLSHKKSFRGPICVEGFYPLYTHKKDSDKVSPSRSSHEHTINGKKYYMPDGVQHYHGNYEK